MSISRAAAGKVEFDRQKALARRRLQGLQNVLIAGIVRCDQHELRAGFERFAGPFDWQNAAVIGERMQDNRHILSGFDDFVEVADGTFAHRAGQRSINPFGFAAFQQVAPDQIGG